MRLRPEPADGGPDDIGQDGEEAGHDDERRVRVLHERAEGERALRPQPVDDEGRLQALDATLSTFSDSPSNCTIWPETSCRPVFRGGIAT